MATIKYALAGSKKFTPGHTFKEEDILNFGGEIVTCVLTIDDEFLIHVGTSVHRDLVVRPDRLQLHIPAELYAGLQNERARSGIGLSDALSPHIEAFGITIWPSYRGYWMTLTHDYEKEKVESWWWTNGHGAQILENYRKVQS